MINAVIIEDEILSREKLIAILKDVAPEINIVATCSSVKESIEYFKTHLPADLIFCDVQLPDGLSFEIFARINTTTPVIFITGFDRFILYAFENNGIDYLLKPISKDDVHKAIIKYKNLQKHFNVQHQSFNNLIQLMNVKKKARLIVKKGYENISMKIEDIVLFYTENRVVYIFDREGKKYLSDKTMNELEADLDDSIFFRANRQYIVNLNFIKSFKSYEKVKLQIQLNIPEVNHLIIISQKTAPDFRSWIMNL
jgi:DNA-binding LytR/AlgR family response regulator